MLYEQTRVSFILCGVAGIIELFLLIYGLHAEKLPIAVVLILCFTLLFVCFFSLRVVLTHEDLLISYGVGLFSKRIPLESIQSIEVVPNSYLTWIYDPSCQHVLRLKLRDGRKALVGIGDAKVLREKISSIQRR